MYVLSTVLLCSIYMAYNSVEPATRIGSDTGQKQLCIDRPS